MSKLFQKVTLCVLAGSLSVAAIAADPVITREQAVERVKKAAEFYKANGKDKSIAEFNNKDSPFNQGGIYMFGQLFDAEITQPIHANPKIRGKQMAGLKDANGVFIIKELNAICEKKGSGWLEYNWPNPATGAIDKKSSYVEKMGDMCIGTGIFTPK